MGKKDSETGKKGLPSFLLSIPQRAKELDLRVVRRSSVDFTGPIFFGGTSQCHPKPHSVALSSHFTHLTEIQSKENIWNNLFKDVSPRIKAYPRKRRIRLVRKKFDFVDVWLHRAPGVRVVAGRGIRRFVPNFGISTSRIKGETIREILDQIPVDSSARFCEREFQRERKRYLLERNRKFLPPEKRAAHFHFPKAFTTVTVFGPPIPASLTVTQLQTTEEEEEDDEVEGIAEEDEKYVDEESSMNFGDDVEGSAEDASEW